MAINEDIFDFIQGPVKLIRGHGYPFCHSLYVEGEKTALADSSCDSEKLQALRRDKRVDLLLCSHAHEDHLGGNYLFPEALFMAHANEAPYLADIEYWLTMFDLTAEEKDVWRDFLRDVCHYVPRQVDRNLKDGDILDLGGVTIEVVHTPGHTSGHCAFYIREEKILYTADLDLMKAGPYYGDCSSDIEDTIRSLARLKTYDVEIYLTAHGRGVYEGNPEYLDRYEEVIFIREKKLLAFLAEGPKTLEQIARERIIYGDRSITGASWDLIISERNMMAKHLARLSAQGVVSRRGDFFVRDS